MLKTDLNKEINKLYTVTIKIFQLIKLQDWKNLTSIIKLNDIDYNIKDDSDTWLLEYLIIFNQIEIIAILLKKDIRLDIKDEQNRSVLYSVIKFSYISILKLLLEKDKDIIGKSILEIKDSDGNIPLFYSIKYLNKEITKEILKYQTNFFNKNANGSNALHLAVQTGDLFFLKLISEKITDINIKQTNGETCLHLAIKNKYYDILKFMLEKYMTTSIINLNVKEFKYDLTPLHYIFLSFDYKLILIFEKYYNYFDANIQDKSGNTFLHYFINGIIENHKTYIKKDILNCVKLIEKMKINYNLFNIDGNTPCHILLSNLDIFKKDYNIIIQHLIEKTDLNIQNINGDSCLFLLVKKKYWQETSEIIVKKKLDIFIIDNEQHIINNYLSSDDLKKFISLMVDSYLYILTNTNYTNKWFDYWDNRCKKNINLKELNDTEKELISNIKLDSNKSLCYNLIYNKITNYMEQFKKNKKKYDVNSYPIHKKYPKLIDNYHNVIVPTFTGSTIDILSGIMYLNNKYNDNIHTSLNLVDLSNDIIKCNTNGICDFYGFEILWKNFQLFIPSNKTTNLMNDLTFIKMNKKIRFYAIPIGIEVNVNNNNYGHANFLLFDFVTLEVERFEPHGSEPPHGINYNAYLLDNLLKTTINEFKLDLKYITPYDYLPKIGFQIKEIYELKNDYIGDPNGFCAVWCFWWIDIRIKNPDINRNKLFHLLTKEMINEKYSYKKIIRDYSYYITSLRDKILSTVGININDWINDTLNTDQKSLLNNIYQTEIKQIIDIS
jgi:ankyrin repeat protein